MKHSTFTPIAFVFGILVSPAAPASATSTEREISVRHWTDAAGALCTETTTVETEPEMTGPETTDPPSADADATEPEAPDAAGRLVGAAAHTPRHAVARFGPFVVVDATHASLIDATDGASPARFAAMLKAWPAIRVLEMADCPGTYNDTANLRLGRMIRAHAIATDVPRGGSVRSGAVELFLAGKSRHAAANAEFGVHAWEDDEGRGPAQFAANAPVNRAYVDYYIAMGMAPGTAVAFYALTNSVPAARVRWLHTADIARYVPLN